MALASLASVTDWRYVATHVVLFGVALFVTAISLVSGPEKPNQATSLMLQHTFLEVAMHPWRPGIASSCCRKSRNVPAEALHTFVAGFHAV